MSIRALIGIVKEFDTPGMERASLSSFLSFSTVIPGRHCDSGFRLITVSNISSGAGSVAVSARPALPKTWATSGIFLMIRSWRLRSFPTSATEAAGHRHRHVEEGPLVEGRHELRPQLHERIDRHGQDDQGQDDHALPEAQGHPGHRLVEAVQDPADGIFLLRTDLPPDEEGHQDRRQGHRQKRGEEHREGLRVGERLEEPSRLGLQREDRQEPDRDDQKRKEERRPDLLGRLDDHLASGPPGRPRASHSSSFLWAFSTMMIEASTIAPIAMAIPLRLMMFEVTPR